MKSRILGLLSVALLAAPMAANAVSVNWSFVAGTPSTGQVGQTISGTISGLVEGSNSGTGLTVNVDSTPTGNLTGGGWVFLFALGGADAFTVSGGNVTFADAYFLRNNSEGLAFGGFGGWLPALYRLDGDGWFSENATTFSSASVPEPGTLALLSLGLAGLGLSRRRKAN